MSAGDSRAGRPPAIGVAVLLSVALVSAALIAYEVVLMRRLLIERWHHFGFLVISVALLGFGASGTLLAVIERYVRRRPVRALRLLAFGLAILILIVPRAAARIPVAARFIPSDLWQQALSPEVLGLLRQGRTAEAKERLLRTLSAGATVA